MSKILNLIIGRAKIKINSSIIKIILTIKFVINTSLREMQRNKIVQKKVENNRTFCFKQKGIYFLKKIIENTQERALKQMVEITNPQYVILGFFRRKKVRRTLNIPEINKMIAGICVFFMLWKIGIVIWKREMNKTLIADNLKKLIVKFWISGVSFG